MGKWADASIGYEQHSGSSTPEEGKYVETINGAPRAPGMKYRHYAPRAKLLLFTKAAVDNGSVLSNNHKTRAGGSGSGIERWAFCSVDGLVYAGLKIKAEQASSQGRPCIQGRHARLTAPVVRRE